MATLPSNRMSAMAVFPLFILRMRACACAAWTRQGAADACPRRLFAAAEADERFAVRRRRAARARPRPEARPGDPGGVHHSRVGRWRLPLRRPAHPDLPDAHPDLARCALG